MNTRMFEAAQKLMEDAELIRRNPAATDEQFEEAFVVAQSAVREAAAAEEE